MVLMVLVLHGIAALLGIPAQLALAWKSAIVYIFEDLCARERDRERKRERESTEAFVTTIKSGTNQMRRDFERRMWKEALSGSVGFECTVSAKNCSSMFSSSSKNTTKGGVLRKPSKAAKLLVKMLKQVPSGKHCQ
jgi:hypothetical protein